MAVRRTRKQKLKAQQRRNETFEWQEVVEKPVKKSQSGPTVLTIKSEETKWLKQDLTRTLLSTLFVVGLIALAYWLS